MLYYLLREWNVENIDELNDANRKKGKYIVHIFIFL